MCQIIQPIIPIKMITGVNAEITCNFSKLLYANSNIKTSTTIYKHLYEKSWFISQKYLNIYLDLGKNNETRMPKKIQDS